ncbi:Peptidase C19 ubiquitin carboxyl-terminal hydrolase 2 [Penicillium robsamsonii]|uniref:Peptidase C19 ubiquitin carboxyl-terminal hydrolase 2 n=1 Tax=Penicillium robsamsonii TaxID=1792511 RepID=UPI0025480930|nr:Peptidase C19 ubiquitin carboxyl-terminal hydrolase 2 [Penicillium robsamsonii]KAJ5836171.1 Peptidase C19 ubiquitin carboxyl-terminal hydrolase 2 [Penicillium robsamsonii]
MPKKNVEHVEHVEHVEEGVEQVEQVEEPNEGDEEQEQVERHVEGEEVYSDKEVKDKTEKRTKSGEDKRTLRPLIPTYWHPDLPDKTTVGFPNGGVDCYRNAVFQMILHMPIFYNWLIWYKEHHAPEGHVCKLGISEDGPTECQVCQLATIAQGYWAGETKSWKPAFRSLTRLLLRGWKPAGTDSEQDPAEYFDVLYNAIKNSTKPMMQGDLEDMFQVEIIMAMKCAGANPCEPRYIPRQQLFMMINLSGEEGDELPVKPTLADIIAQHFDHQDDYGACEQCGGTRTSTDHIGSFPELLLVQLNRTSAMGEKISTHVYLSEDLDIETRFMDERWGNERKVIQYKLTSMVLHHGRDVTQGHYSMGVKGKGDEWVKANDLEITDWIPEGPGCNPNHLPTGYLFTYRRLPTNDKVQTEGEAAKGGRTPEPEDMQVDSNFFADFVSGLPEVDDIPSRSEGLVRVLDVVIPKVLDTYIACTAESRRKEFEKWADEWEKKRGVKRGIQETSAIGPDIGDNEEILNWTKERGRLEITLTGDKGKGAKLLDLEVQGMHFNRLKNNKREREEEEVDREKEKTFSKIFNKVKGKAKNYDETGGNGKKKSKK